MIDTSFHRRDTERIFSTYSRSSFVSGETGRMIRNPTLLLRAMHASVRLKGVSGEMPLAHMSAIPSASVPETFVDL